MKKCMKLMKQYPMAAISALILIVVTLLVVFAPVIAPYDPAEMDLLNTCAGSSKEHLLGADMQGRDIFSRILYGGRIAMLSPLCVVAISLFIGVPLGFITGFFGGKIDNIIMRICDVILSFPAILLALISVSIFGRGIRNTIIVLGFFYIPFMARMIRATVMVQKEESYVEACYALGYSKLKIMVKHLLPNCISTIIVQATLCLGYSMLDLAGMSYLGLGVQAPTADWGSMLAEGKSIVTISPNMVIYSGFAIMLVVVCFNLLGDGLDSYFDPKRKKV
ncbi:MAG: ABC transporter permease [Lachnospiraceae bacterium]|nr:ABC transporter permease [Lachnospiraceae bacterium]